MNHADVGELVRKHQTGDRSATSAIVREYDGLIRQVVRRATTDQSMRDDLYQEACIIVLDLLNRFDATRATLYTMIRACLFPRLLEAMHDSIETVRVPSWVHRRATKARKAGVTTEQDVARVIGRQRAPEVVMRALARSVEYKSIDDPLWEEALSSEAPAPDVAVEAAQICSLLRWQVSALDADEQEILRRRYEDDETCDQVGKRLGKSGEWARQKEIRVVEKLRKRMAA